MSDWRWTREVPTVEDFYAVYFGFQTAVVPIYFYRGENDEMGFDNGDGDWTVWEKFTATRAYIVRWSEPIALPPAPD